MSPPLSPASPPLGREAELKLSSVSPGTKLQEQKPFRGFDITSLIRKDDPETAAAKTAASPEAKVVTSATPTSSSPTLSRGPPIEKSSNPYAGLFGSGLYHQYLGHILSSQQQGGQAPAPPSPAPFPPFNPMLLQAQLAMAAHNNPLLAMNMNNANMISERLKQNRFSPYSMSQPTNNAGPPPNQTSPSPLTSGLASAFKALGGGGITGSKPNPTEEGCGSVVSPPVSPPHSASPPPSVKSEPGPVSPPQAGLRSDIKNIENMINGLNGTSDGRFSLSHAQATAAAAAAAAGAGESRIS